MTEDMKMTRKLPFPFFFQLKINIFDLFFFALSIPVVESL